MVFPPATWILTHVTSFLSYETISDLMGLQDQIESFQRIIFAHFRNSTNNECRISALVPLVKESWGIYRFITSMLRAMYRSKYQKDLSFVLKLNFRRD